MAEIVMQITRIEAVNLAELLGQFREVLSATDAGDPAVQRLVPDAYPDDADAARQFRDLTQTDLLARRDADAETVLSSLGAPLTAPHTQAEAVEELTVTLSDEQLDAWLRSLTALRLVLATRLGVTDESDHSDDPRYNVYEWLGYRLEMLIELTD